MREKKSKAGGGKSISKALGRRAGRSAAMPLRSIDLLLEEQNPPLVTIIGAEASGAGPKSGPPRPPPPPPPAPRAGAGRSLPAPASTDPRAVYKDDGVLARGGMSTIRKAVDTRLRRTVAMKTFDAPEDARSPRARRFLDEAQITGQLDHPNIVPIYELAVAPDGRPSFFTMKVVRGRDLGKLIDEVGDDRLESHNLERLIQSVLKACEAISFAHSHGVIHRDLKPANVMVGSHGQTYVMDWGLALVRTGRKVADEEERHHAIGTPAYMAPEQAHARIDEIDERTDVFGLGGILYAVLTGRPPYQTGSPIKAVELAQQCKIEHPTKVPCKRPMPPELCRITMKALSARRLDRYATVAELQADLEQFLRGGGWLETRVYPPGAEIICEGDEAHEAFIVVKGTCEAYQQVRTRRVTLRRMGPGEVFGETVFLAGRRRMANVEAIDEVTVKVITKEALERELERSTWVKSFVTVLAERFRDVATSLAELRDGLRE